MVVIPKRVKAGPKYFGLCHHVSIGLAGSAGRCKQDLFWPSIEDHMSIISLSPFSFYHFVPTSYPGSQACRPH